MESGDFRRLKLTYNLNFRLYPVLSVVVKKLPTFRALCRLQLSHDDGSCNGAETSVIFLQHSTRDTIGNLNYKTNTSFEFSQYTC